MTARAAMRPAAIRRLMAREWTPPAGATEAEADDGNPIDPAIARVLLQCRETVAEAVCEAYVALRALGVDRDHSARLLRPLDTP